MEHYTHVGKNYDYYNSKYGRNINRRCINGSITGCGKCVAYCEYAEHKGFLTNQLREKHQCIEKGCKYYVPKEQSKKNSRKKQDQSSQIVAIAIAATHEMEGLKVLRASKNTDDVWTIYYVTVAGYFLDAIKSHIEEKTGEKVYFKKIDCDFDVATNLVFS